MELGKRVLPDDIRKLAGIEYGEITRNNPDRTKLLVLYRAAEEILRGDVSCHRDNQTFIGEQVDPVDPCRVCIMGQKLGKPLLCENVGPIDYI
jgi:hypothetical protein